MQGRTFHNDPIEAAVPLCGTTVLYFGTVIQPLSVRSPTMPDDLLSSPPRTVTVSATRIMSDCMALCAGHALFERESRQSLAVTILPSGAIAAEEAKHKSGWRIDVNFQAERQARSSGRITIAAFGVVSIIEGHRLGTGSLTRMEPGYVPFALGVFLVLLGALMTFGGDGAADERVLLENSRVARLALHHRRRRIVSRSGSARRTRSGRVFVCLHFRAGRSHRDAARRLPPRTVRDGVRRRPVSLSPDDPDTPVLVVIP